MAEIQEFISSKAKKEVEKYKTDILEIVGLYGKMVTSSKAVTDTQKKQANTQQELDNKTIAYNNLLKQLNSTSGKLQVAESGLNKELIRQKQKLQEVNKDIRANTSLYGTLSRTLDKNRAKAKEVGLQYGINSKQFKKAQKEVIALDSKIKKLDASLGQSQRNVGNYTSATANMGKSLIGAFGVVGGLALFAAGIKDVIRIGREYEKQNAVLASVLGKTLKETKLLQKESKKLGSSTAFSATQVTELQTELAKLGKSEEDIIDSTEGIIDATLALGSDTGETAKLVGGTMNAFQLAATESTYVADLLTLSTQKSALGFSELSTGIPIAAGAAAAAGIPLSRLTAQLGKAADRGIDASSAATSLRNIYITLADKGMTLDTALQQINVSQNKLSTATKLFGKRAATTALALADNVDETNDLTEALENAGGTAKRVAETQLNTLDGQLKLMNSAWEGLVLNINNADTAIGGFSKKFIGFLTKALNQFANLGKEWDLFKKSLIGGWEDANSATLLYLANSGRVEDSAGRIRQVKDVFDEVAEGYKNLTYEEQQYVDVNREMVFALLKAGGETEAVDGIAREYLKTLNLEKQLLKDVNFEYDDTADLLEDQARNKEELNEITKEAIRLADEELERKKRQITVDDEIKRRGDELKEGDQQKAQFTEEAEANAEKLAAANIERLQREQEQDAALAESKAAIKVKEQEQGAANLANMATLASKAGAINKAAALKQALIDGKAAVVSAFKYTPGPLPLKIAAAALAGIVAAKNVKDIIATKTAIPAFEKGTNNTPDTYIAGEAGREIRKDKRGNMSIIDKPTLFTNDAGNKILSNPETEKILRSDAPSMNSLNTQPIVNAIRENKSTMNVALDKMGIINVSKNGQSVTKHVNRKYRNRK